MSLNNKTDYFVEKASKIHGRKFDYSKSVYVNSRTKIEIICKEHGSFFQLPQSHYSGLGGCKECARKSYQSCDNKNNKSQDKFLEQAREKHKNKYDYSEIRYKNSHTKIKIICPEHGPWDQTPASHLVGNGCAFCAGVKSNTKIFIEKSIKIHGGRYDYSIVNYLGKMIKVKIICRDHGVFNQIPKRHLGGLGCPDCNDTKGESKIRQYLKFKNIPFISEHCFPDCKDKGWLRFDFYLPDRNIIIEYDGKQHFEPIEWFGGIAKFEDLQRKDLIKNHYCSQNNIGLIRIRYDEDVDSILKKYL